MDLAGFLICMENIKLRRRTELTGKRFGRLIVIKASERKTLTRAMYWICKCDCGTEKEISALSLVRGLTVSCGCYNKEINTNRIKHGHNRKNGKKSPTYISWEKMIARCKNEICTEYKWYGGRGITVCDRWLDFSTFLEDMGERILGTTIDRINHNGNYEPNNCRWAVPIVQANNTRINVHITYNNQTKTVAEWARVLGIEYDTLYYRLFKYKWSIEKALNHPIVKHIKTQNNAVRIKR